ncbi:helix-turn-helix transcriptional regulator [Pseudomonas sp. P108]|jgi:transcriptional regulator with XRE-family HTH domain|uniref:helix-turn-helix domain-containing protein n=1 Tax=Pseudomonas sp. P108 TaxID=1837993 RepID=UPI0029347AA3|nr:helix-turn-helix transcriptional regulator [Pseudomonas sp. P108]WNZ85161.1 helix-turn-helix transcriptional regulator [Pseudomonas sp. P108]
MRELNDAFAQALRDMRHKADLAQTDFAPKVSREYISLLERGLRSPSLKAIDDLAEGMGISPLALVLQCYLHRDPSTSFETLLAKAVRDVRLEMIPGRRKDEDAT